MQLPTLPNYLTDVQLLQRPHELHGESHHLSYQRQETHTTCPLSCVEKR